MQRYFPTWSATYDESGNVISMQGPTIETYIFSILSSCGFVMSAVSFSVLVYGFARARNT